MVAYMCTRARGKKIYVYRCEYHPNHWHLSHRLGKDGINIHAPGFNYLTFDADAKFPKPNGARIRLNRSWLQKLQGTAGVTRMRSVVGSIPTPGTMAL